MVESALTQSEEQFRNERRIDHLIAILKATRDVSKLMLREKEQDSLIQGVCDALIRTHGCESSWIVLTDSDMNLKTSASAGMGKNFITIIDKFKSKELPHCCKLAIENPGLAIINDPEYTCDDCILSPSEKDNGVITYHLEYRGRMFGFLYVAILQTFICDEEIQALVEDVAMDLSFALFSAGLENQHRKTQDEIKKIHDSGEIRDVKARSPDQAIPGGIYDWKDKLILIVEDNLSNYLFFKETLKKTRVQILWVAKGQEAIEICRSTENIDLILMDVRLPDINGAEVTRQIRMFEKDLPIVALTAYFNPEAKEKCINAGCDDYVDKPIKPDMFLSMVSNYLKSDTDANFE
ncbi:MAG: response regulator [Bacteroidales bacterium]|nr:response regulator [Bacteroidales bacterium]